MTIEFYALLDFHVLTVALLLYCCTLTKLFFSQSKEFMFALSGSK